MHKKALLTNLLTHTMRLAKYIIKNYYNKMATTELQKFMSSYFFVWDEEMMCDVTGEPSICITSDINEELGQVK